MMEKCKLVLGDCLEKVRDLPDASVDLCLTDPPYGLEFMGKEWDKLWTKRDAHKDSSIGRKNDPYIGARVDKYVGGKTAEDFHKKWASAVFPKLKPGAFLVFTMSPRQDLLWRCLAGLEKAGFVLGTSGMYWLYHTGFPKALDIYKKTNREQDKGWKSFQLKPAVECIVVAQKPRSEKTIVGQVLATGTGACNIEACRIPYVGAEDKEKTNVGFKDELQVDGWTSFSHGGQRGQIEGGRFPANLLCGSGMDIDVSELLKLQSELKKGCIPTV